MSTLGSISGNLERERQLLSELNSALLTLESQALGRSAEFGFTDEEIAKSRQTLIDFVMRLRSALDQPITPIDVQSLVYRLKSGMKPLEDWQEDLDGLLTELKAGEHLTNKSLPILEEILSLLDDEFTEDLKRLYSR